MFNKLKLGDTDECNCGTGKMIARHLLHECPIYAEQRKTFWPTPASFEDKLYGDVSELKLTAAFFSYIQVDI